MPLPPALGSDGEAAPRAPHRRRAPRLDRRWPSETVLAALFDSRPHCRACGSTCAATPRDRTGAHRAGAWPCACRRRLAPGPGLPARNAFPAPELWLPAAAGGVPPLPRRHRRQAPPAAAAGARRGMVYRRHLQTLGAEISLRTIDPRLDLHTFHRWMNDPRVDAFWEESGPVEKHAAYLARASRRSAGPRPGRLLPRRALRLLRDLLGPGGPHRALLRRRRLRPRHPHAGGRAPPPRSPQGRRLAPLAGPLPVPGRPAHPAVVAEPRADNAKMIGYLQQTGFYRAKHFDFPHKRAALMVLSREVFFSERSP